MKLVSLDRLGDNIFIEIITYLHSRNIFISCLLINKYSSHLSRSNLLWKQTFLESPKQIGLFLYQAINKKLWDFLGDPNFIKKIDNINLEIILSWPQLSSGFPLVSLMNESQYSLKRPYLIQANQKIKLLKEKVMKMIEGIKPYGFAYLQDFFINEDIPVKEFDEKSEEKLKYKETRLLRLLQSLRNIVERDLITYHEKINQKKLEFLQFYFKILFWDNNSIKSLNNKKDFFKFTLDQFPRYQLNLSTEEKDDQKTQNKESVDGITLACELENFHVLGDSKEYLTPIFKLGDDHLQYLSHLTDPKILLSDFIKNIIENSISKNQEAILEFFYEHGINSTSETPEFAQDSALQISIKYAIRSQKYNPIFLAILYGKDLYPSEKENLGGHLSFHLVRFNIFLILQAAQIDFEKTIFLESLVETTKPMLASVRGGEKKAK